jgi:hypothetical protein
VTLEKTIHMADELMHDAFGTSSEEEAEEGHKEDEGQQQLANYMFSLIFKLHFIFNY